MSQSDLDAAFRQRCEVLTVYALREGHSCVPVAHKERGFALGRWVAVQRSHYHAGKLSQQNIEALEAMEGWTWRASDFQWDEGMAALRLFFLREGHVLVPNNTVESRFALGVWVNKQRKRLRNNRLTPEQAQEFTQFGPMDENWRKKRNHKRWDARFEVLKLYADTHGTSEVPRKHIEQGVALGVWVNSLRSQYSKGGLAADLIQRLESLPNWAWAKPRKKKEER